MTRPFVLVLLTASAMVTVAALRSNTAEPSPAPPKGAKADEPKLDLVFANRLHRHFYWTCDLPDCKVGYAGPLAHDMPTKTFILDYNYERCSCWAVIYKQPGTGLQLRVAVFDFRMEKREDDVASGKIDGQMVYCSLATEAHDDTPEILRKRADQPITAFAKVEKLKDVTHRQLARLLLREAPERKP